MALKPHHSQIFQFTSTATQSQAWQAWLLGRPLATADASHQTIGKLVGLAVFASDALSSTAYATQEIMMVLAAAGTLAFSYALPVAVAIMLLMTIVTISYEQTIHAYPGGGGAYIVARDNLGELPAQTAGAALLMDYILTVAVSVSSGVAQVTSAFAVLYPYRVWIAVALVMLIAVINLRGVKESGVAFAIPTYYFVLIMFLTVGVGLVRWLTGNLGVVINPPEMHHLTTAVGAITPFLLLHAFSNGTSALTGIEAISNGITAFKEPRSRNAGVTLIWMSAILGSLFLSITLLASKIQAVPSETETVISQLARTVYGGQNLLYLGVISGTALILVLAANTAFADFPRLGALHAGDGFLPRQLTYRGSRLVYSHGIMALAIIASVLIILFQASVTRLIPLYAIGVFLSFSLSQTGMARRWWKSGHLKIGDEVQEPGSVLRYDRRWLFKMVVNGFGALSTAIVMVVFAVTKFREGAWIVILLTPTLVTIFFAIHHHYRRVAEQLSLEKWQGGKPISRDRVIVLVGGVHQGTLAAMRFANTISRDVTAVHVAVDPKETEKVQERWQVFGEGMRMIILHSPYRLLIEPLLEYLEKVEAAKKQSEIITIVVPSFHSRTWWEKLLHMRTAETLRKVLLNRDDIVVVEVPYQIR